MRNRLFAYAKNKDADQSAPFVFAIWIVQSLYYLYYPYSKNKGDDQLRGYRKADLCLCFRICKKPVFSQRGSFIVYSDTVSHLSSTPLIKC